MTRAQLALAAAAADLASIAMAHRRQAQHLRRGGMARPARIRAEERAATVCDREAQRLAAVATAAQFQSTAAARHR